jgi:type I restriction enzyme, R subunit
VTACVEVLREVKIRAEFVVRLKLFMESLDIVLPRPEALPYVRDAKISSSSTRPQRTCTGTAS